MTTGTMKRAIDQIWILPPDVLVIPVAELGPKLRGRLGCAADEFALARRNSRVNSIIIDADTERLVTQFREPKTIVQAVVDYSREAAVDASAALADAFPLLQRLTGRGLLVPPDSVHAAAIAFSHEIGSQIAGHAVVSCVQVYEDNELYQVRSSEGAFCALKLMHTNANAHVADRFEREAAVLRHLHGRSAPSLLAEGECDGRPYLLLEWCPGRTASEAAELMRAETEWWAPDLVRLCMAVARTYAELHQAGVIHADVHPRNILCAENGTVRLIDFGLASLASSTRTFISRERAGVGYYFEPEYAAALRQDSEAPVANPASEQYAVAALLYHLLTGVHYLEFSLDRERMLEQIVEAPPLSFAARGLQPWPAVEEVLARALSKLPAERYHSTSDFADAFTAACGEPPSETRSQSYGACPSASDPGEALVQTIIGRYGLDSTLTRAGLTTDPLCSVNFGGAGIAYALYRLASVRDDSRLLFLADVWSQRALRDITDAWAFRSRELNLDDAVDGAVSLYHTAAGVYCVQALIGDAMGDVATTNEGIRNFIHSSRNPTSQWDLTIGRAGTLIGAACLLEVLDDSDRIDTHELRALGDETLAWIWSQFDGFGPISECQQIPYLGVAHGWAGVIYAGLRWGAVCGVRPPELERRLDELLACAESVDDGLIWRRKTGNPAHERMPWAGWCHGTAGYVHLFTLAYRTFGEERYLAAAERAAWTTWRHSHAPSSNLCCGLAGQAYALLNLHRHSGENTWLVRARELSARAVAEAASPRLRPNSLYRGDVGIALLAADLTRPETGCMPLFEAQI
jgi:eukaryotic-like serine/threonine-protein kinase